VLHHFLEEYGVISIFWKKTVLYQFLLHFFKFTLACLQYLGRLEKSIKIKGLRESPLSHETMESNVVV
jgi:hypothetical protein